MKMTASPEQVADYLSDYWGTYKDQNGYGSYSMDIVLDDALYGVGAAMNEDYRFGNGYDAFKKDLLQVLLTDEIKNALLDAKSVAMNNTIAARIPECGEFGGIAQNLAYVCEQLGIKDS